MARKTTRNAQGGGTIRQRKDGRWEARYTVGRDPGTGKQIQRSVYGSTQREVRQKLAQITASIDTGTYKEPCRMTLGQWLDIWQKDYLRDVKESTAALHEMQIRLHIKPAIGAIRLEALNPHDIQELYNRMSDEKGLSALTVKALHSTLHKALQQAVSNGYIRTNPTDACMLPRVEKKEITPLDAAQTAAFLKVIEGHKFERLYKLALFTGMREGEIMGLPWDAVDFDKGTITIRQQLHPALRKGEGPYITTPKSGKPRTITPAPFVMRLLKSQRARQAEQRLKAGPFWEDSGLVFTNERGGFLARNTMYNNFKRLAAQAGVPDARFHDLRHTYAVTALQVGDDIKTVQQNLGHHTAAFTLDTYAHVTEDMKKSSANRMEDFIKQVLNL